MLSMVVSSVAYSGGAKVTPDIDALKERVKKRWMAKIDYDFASAYKFQTPAYKDVFSKELYVHLFSKNLVWELKGVNGIEFDEVSEVATVKVDIETSSVNPVNGDRKSTALPARLTEKWLHIDGQWWHSSSK